MLSTRARWLLPALVLLAGLWIGNEAQAERRVDWSQYLEPPGSRPAPKAERAAPQKTSKASKAKKAKRGSKAAKQRAAKAKRKSARSRRR